MKSHINIFTNYTDVVPRKTVNGQRQPFFIFFVFCFCFS